MAVSWRPVAGSNSFHATVCTYQHLLSNSNMKNHFFRLTFFIRSRFLTTLSDGEERVSSSWLRFFAVQPRAKFLFPICSKRLVHLSPSHLHMLTKTTFRPSGRTSRGLVYEIMVQVSAPQPIGSTSWRTSLQSSRRWWTCNALAYVLPVSC